MKIPLLNFQEFETQIILFLKKCTNFKHLKMIHCQITVSSLSQSTYLATQMINTCNSIGEASYAALIFDQIAEPNIFLYNAMIRTYTQNRHYYETITLYKQMLRMRYSQTIFADRFTYPFVIKACSGLLLLCLGKQIQSHILKCGLASISIVQNSFVEMYSKCEDLTNVRQLFDEMAYRDVLSYNTLISAYARLGQTRKAREIFDLMPNRTIVSWTAIICGYSSCGSYSKAIDAFHRMQLEGFEPDDISIVSILPACSQLGAHELGKWLHAYSNKHGFMKKTYVCNAFIEMYSKCGNMGEARQIFYNMKEKDVISWSSVIVGLATHGRAHEAIELFKKMENEKKVCPNIVTFIGVLTACAHAGLIDEGLHYFNSMIHDGFEPEIQHYGCLIDLLGRSGCIASALEIAESMPMEADAAIWGSLLGASRTHGDIGTAVKAMEKLVELEPDDSGNYVLLSNAYASIGDWDGVAKLRRIMRVKSLQRKPGCSSIEVNNMVKEFIAGDCQNSSLIEVQDMLNMLALNIGESKEHETVRMLFS